MLAPLLLAAFACTPQEDDSGDGNGDSAASACLCEDPEPLDFAATLTGGYDDWGGTAVFWGVDADAGRAVVVAARFDMPAYEVPVSPVCGAAEETVSNWSAAVPDAARDAVESYPLLATILTDALGIRSLGQDAGALMVEGDLQAATPARLFVATGGAGSIVRGESGTVFQGALEFAAEADAVGGDVVDACDPAVRVSRLDLGASGPAAD